VPIINRIKNKRAQLKKKIDRLKVKDRVGKGWAGYY
jgi:hypothetical protein